MNLANSAILTLGKSNVIFFSSAAFKPDAARELFIFKICSGSFISS